MFFEERYATIGSVPDDEKDGGEGDGEVDREFNETHISGVNNNAYSFDITLDTDYTLEEGDTVMVQYPAIDNPSEAGEYEVEIRVNDQQVSTTPLTIE